MGYNATHPGRYGFPCMLLKYGTEGAVAAISALESQLLGGIGAPIFHRIMIQICKMTYAEVIDVSVVCETLLRKVLAKVVTVCPYDLGKLRKGKVMLKV